MPYLIAAVVLLGLLCLLNLVLTYGVVRRLRRHSEILAAREDTGQTGGSTAPAGTELPPFSAVSVQGGELSERSFTAPTLVGFFSPGCPPCEALIPRFVAAAAAGGSSALAVVEEEEGMEAYVGRLRSVATVVAGPQARVLAKAFAVRGYPAICLVGAGGVIADTGVAVVDRVGAIRS
ncbi:hypothetical protein [Catellatospora sp. NPDC049609]|uniref:TlpA family protein disulfide reductase n=1 Tax=Catellatospora sp. NPDC049609 TaxID=3155505 RepID=UPI0034187E64